jgi:glutamate/tyrosine decarboxylase-like PLP-dependent enzyme
MSTGLGTDAADAVLLPQTLWPGLWNETGSLILEAHSSLPDASVCSDVQPREIRERLATFDFVSACPPEEVLQFSVEGLRKWQTHAGHPGYWGLYVPAPSTMGILADAIVAAFNPQLANWSHSPFAIELEQHVLAAFAAKIGYPRESAEGTFTTGGAEANHTALLCALLDAFPQVWHSGLRGLDRAPTIYVSAEAHHSWIKAARVSGLGDDAVRRVAVDDRGRMLPAALDRILEFDHDAARKPVLIVATAGTTSEGAVDPISDIAEVARNHRVFLHVDAAWAGALVASPQLRELIAGIEEADSISFDAHKWLSVPMGAGLFLTRRAGVLSNTFDVATDYMPNSAIELDVVDPYRRSLQWSRRFIGLKVFMTLAVAGWDGYARTFQTRIELGQRMRESLEAAKWRVVNDTELPVVCVVDATCAGGSDRGYVEAIVAAVLREGRAWVSATTLSGRGAAIRCCVSNMRSTEDDLRNLVLALDRARVVVTQ